MGVEDFCRIHQQITTSNSDGVNDCCKIAALTRDNEQLRAERAFAVKTLEGIEQHAKMSDRKNCVCPDTIKFVQETLAALARERKGE